MSELDEELKRVLLEKEKIRLKYMERVYKTTSLFTLKNFGKVLGVLVVLFTVLVIIDWYA